MANLGHPSETYYKDIVCSNMIAHFTVTLSDVDVANKIFSSKIPSLKIKK